MTFSVIIPTLNEERHIGSCIRSVRAADRNGEIIVVDGGSQDRTSEIALKEGATVRSSAPGRGIQFNHGAAFAHGDIFVFLHADTLVSPEMFSVLRNGFQDPNMQIGRCSLRFDVRHPLLQLYAWCAQVDSVITTFGDQCIVIRRSFFETLGGFSNWKILEDVDFLQRARGKTCVHLFPTPVVTSARRFIKHGIVRQQLYNAAILSLYIAGVSPDRLVWMYNKTVSTHLPASREQDIAYQPAKL